MRRLDWELLEEVTQSKNTIDDTITKRCGMGSATTSDVLADQARLLWFSKSKISKPSGDKNSRSGTARGISQDVPLWQLAAGQTVAFLLDHTPTRDWDSIPPNQGWLAARGDTLIAMMASLEVRRASITFSSGSDER